MHKKRFDLKIVLIFLLFFLPFPLAWYFSTLGGGQFATTNHGYLLHPPLAIEHLNLISSQNATTKLRGKWLLLFMYPKDCDEQCRERLYYMRQVRTALGKDQDRIQRIIVTPEGLLTPLLGALLPGEYHGTQQFFIKTAELNDFLQKIPNAATLLPQGVVLIVDPLGNIVLFYAPKVKPRDWLRDLKRLLSASQIG